MRVIRTGAKLGVGAALFAGMMCWSGDVRPLTHGELFPQAEARVGRPATPVSYAGVARRTTRRTVAYGAAVTPTVVVAPTPVCATTYDAYGRAVTVCN